MSHIMFLFRVCLLLATSPLFSAASPPEIVENPVDLTVSRGSPATLNCAATGSPEPNITWLRDGRPVLSEGDHVVQLPGGALFFLRTVQNARSQDSGLYSCRAENRDGMVESRPARLTVTYLKAKFGEVAREIQVEEGAELRLPCLPPEGFPAPSVYWEKDGATLINDDYFVIEPSGDLVIEQAGPEDVGQYVCLASNGGEATRRDTAISVSVTRRAVVIDRRLPAEIPPTVVEAFMLDAVTGLVHWRPLADASGYVVRVSANNGGLEVTNISVEADVNQVKLHSLDPNLSYRVQVAALYGGGSSGGKVSAASLINGAFSVARQLSAKTHEVILVDSNSGGGGAVEDIPLKVWAIAMAVVILVTLTIVLAAALLCYKSRRAGGGLAGGRHACSDYYDTRHAGGSHYGWLDGRWNGGEAGGGGSHDDDGDSPTTSFRSNNRLLQAGCSTSTSGAQYDYAVPSLVMAGKVQQYGGSNHYASNTILKPAYYEPLNASVRGGGRGQQQQPANLSFDSDYKAPLDSSSGKLRR